MRWFPLSDLPPDQTAPLQQHVHYGRTCTLLGTDVCSFGAGDPDNPIAYAQILRRRWPVVGPVSQLARGPVWTRAVSAQDAATMTQSLSNELRKSNRGVIVIGEPVAEHDANTDTNLLPLFTAATHARLDLHGTTEDRLMRQHGKWRNRLRNALGGPLIVEQSGMPSDADHWLLRCEVEQSKALRYRALPPAFTVAWRRANGAKSTRLFVARLKGNPVAAMLFLCHGQAATYHIGWSDEAGRQNHAHNRLLWAASEWFAGRGFKWIDLGLIDTETRPSLARFKIGSGAVAHPLGATYLSAFGTGLVRLLTPSVGFRSRQSRQAHG